MCRSPWQGPIFGSRIADLVTPTRTSLPRMSWQIDRRNGATRSGDSRREGVAPVSDQARHLIAFQVLSDNGYGSAAPEPSALDQFVISEGDFEPDAA